METIWKTKIRYIRPTSILLFSIPAVVWLTMQGYSATWTGFASPGGEALGAKTLWDWMDLLLVPLFIAAGAVVLNRSQRISERQRAQARLALEQEIESDRQQEESLQAYFDRIIELVLKDKLSKFSPDEVRNVAKTRTLTVLRRLDGRRKGLVILFLRDSGLIDRTDAVIDLCGADLRGAHLPQASLKRVNLAEADLTNADLHGANLSKSYLGATNLSGANLHGANLGGADLFEANLNGADLTQSNLREAHVTGADLRGCRLNGADIRQADLSGVNLNVSDLVKADLRGAKLDGAKLLGADFSQADLSGTQVTGTELEKAKSLEGTTMPDGTRHN
jgi:uncharacterized protein YjbI with pentapeptide repeats